MSLRAGFCRLAAVLLLCALVAGCSVVKLAYNQAPQLLVLQLHRHVDLTETQTERLRAELAELHQWHRSAMLVRHTALLQKTQQQLTEGLTPAQACRVVDEFRAQFNHILAHAVPRLAWLAQQLSDAQIRHLERRQADTNADWRKEWLARSPGQMQEHRYQRLLDQAQTYYGSLDEPQKTVLRAFVAESAFDPQRIHAERLRRQQDLVQMLRHINSQRLDVEQTRAQLRAYVARLAESPDTQYQRYAQTLQSESCEAFARLHNTMAPAQRLKAAQTIQGYERDLVALAAP